MPDFRDALPAVDLLSGLTASDVETEMSADYASKYAELTGKTADLSLGTTERMRLAAAAPQIYQAMQYVNTMLRMQLLKYSRGEYLDNLGAIKNVTRKAASAASTTLRFSMTAVRTSATGIPAGTRAATETGVYFATEEYAEIAPGELYVDVPARCLLPGTLGNGFLPGAVGRIVDPLPYIAAVANVTASAGGAAVESDADLAYRAYLAPSAYSTAGPEEAYKYRVLEYSADIGDVQVSSVQQAGTVDITFLMKDGSAPTTEVIDGLLEYLQTGPFRPMNDLVRASAPEEVAYAIDFSYWINLSDRVRAASIQTAVEQAVQEYIRWQRAIGRDINPDELRMRVKQAGAKRLEIRSPVFTPVEKYKVAALTGAAVVYGGLEHD